MKRGFETILAAQFFSALADNALLFAAIALLAQRNAPQWETPVLQQGFVLSFIVLAPVVGAFADALPKGRVMLISNGVKILGCAAMLAGLHPLLAYGFVGLGAALYSPAKYGILTEFLPPEKLVWGNGWMEGLTVAAIILGAVIGGFLIDRPIEQAIVDRILPASLDPGVAVTPAFPLVIILGLYLLAAAANLRIPRLPVELLRPERGLMPLVDDFRRSFTTLWRDPLASVSMAVTTLFWGAGTTLRLLILAWSSKVLGFSLEQGTQLTAVVAVGIGAGAVWAARSVPLDRAVRVLRIGIAMGLTVAAMNFVTDWRLALAVLLAIGIMGGCFVVPMNALLQHRGHLLMGAGHSIAVQNFNENLSILSMLGIYGLMLKAGFEVDTIVIVFGLVIAGAMTWLNTRHRHDQD